MDAAVLFVALLAAGVLIVALLRSRGGSTTSFTELTQPVRVTQQVQSKTFSLDELPPELQAEGNELAQLALKAKAGGPGLSAADKERLLELTRDLAARAPESMTAPSFEDDDHAIRLMHVETRSKIDAEPSIWDEQP